MNEREKNDLLGELPKKRVTPILCLSDQDLFDAGIDPASITDKQFLEIAEGLRYRYEEEMAEEKQSFQSNLKVVVEDEEGIYYDAPNGKYRNLEIGDMPYFNNQEKVWL